MSPRTRTPAPAARDPQPGQAERARGRNTPDRPVAPGAVDPAPEVKAPAAYPTALGMPAGPPQSSPAGGGDCGGSQMWPAPGGNGRRPGAGQPSIGSLCSGYGGLDEAVQQVFGGELRWVADSDPAAAKVLAHHFPDVPNLGDITATDWAAVEPVDIVTAGFPCQPVSNAGRRVGATDERWLWDDVARAIATLRPRVVVLENVRGLLTSPGRQAGCVCGWNHRWGGQLRHRFDHDERPDPVLADGCRADGQAPRPERVAHGAGRSSGTSGSARPQAGLGRNAALGALGIVAAVSAGGAAAVLDCEEGTGGIAARDARPGVASLNERARYLLDAGDLGRVAEGQGPDSGAEPAGHGGDQWSDCPACGRPLDDAADRPVRRAVGDVLWSLSRLGFDARWLTLRASDVGAPHRRERVFILAWPATDSAGAGREGQGPEPARRGPERGRRAAADAQGNGRHEGRPEPARQQRGPDAALGRPTPAADADRHPVREQPEPEPGRGRTPVAGLPGIERRLVADTDGGGRRPEPRQQCGERAAERLAADIAWGDYEPAVRRWEHITGRPAPSPTEPGRHGKPRLSPAFVEFMMGLPAGHVTAVPGLTRNDMLRALGNGVVPAQGAAALRQLLTARAVAA